MRANLAVVSRRSEPPDSLDYFPTPPWATRALFKHVIDMDLSDRTVREPCCGEGHMAAVLAEHFALVHASDVFDYGYGEIEDYTLPAVDRSDWVVTNPPFNKAEALLNRALQEAREGVALLLRSVWLHGVGRYRNVFSKAPPSTVAPFAERVAMVKGRWEPEASTATDYCWFVWTRVDGSWHAEQTAVRWIPPGRKKALTRPDDYNRFAAKRPAPLLEEAGR